jgi:ankyrin repeat protein
MNETATEKDPFWLQQALLHGGDPNASNAGNRHSPGSTPIYYAVDARRTENVKILIKARADVNRRNGYGEILLREALLAGTCEMVVDLLEAGADPQLKDNHGHDFVEWMQDYDERFVHQEENKPWFRKIRAILIERGLLEPTPEELSNAQGTKTPDSP